MRPDEIQENRFYTNDPNNRYWRRVEAIVDANPVHWPGRKRVCWSTDGWPVRGGGRTHGSCFLETFARWAKAELPERKA